MVLGAIVSDCEPRFEFGRRNGAAEPPGGASSDRDKSVARAGNKGGPKGAGGLVRGLTSKAGSDIRRSHSVDYIPRDSYFPTRAAPMVANKFR
jgi:hypothetical protein